MKYTFSCKPVCLIRASLLHKHSLNLITMTREYEICHKKVLNFIYTTDVHVVTHLEMITVFLKGILSNHKSPHSVLMSQKISFTSTNKIITCANFYLKTRNFSPTIDAWKTIRTFLNVVLRLFLFELILQYFAMNKAN